MSFDCGPPSSAGHLQIPAQAVSAIRESKRERAHGWAIKWLARCLQNFVTTSPVNKRGHSLRRSAIGVLCSVVVLCSRNLTVTQWWSFRHEFDATQTKKHPTNFLSFWKSIKYIQSHMINNYMQRLVEYGHIFLECIITYISIYIYICI